MRSAALVLVLAASGCDALLGIEDPRLGGDADAGVDAAAADVTGSSTVSWYPGTAVPIEVPEDLSTYTIAALVPDPAEPSGFRVIEGTGTADGNFTIRDVPAGTYYLKVIATAGTPTYYVTDRRVLDYGTDILGRPDAEPTTLVTPVTLTIEDMTAWPGEGEIWVDVFQSGTEAYVYNVPQLAATTLDSVLDWSMDAYAWSGRPALPDAAAGDEVTIAVTGSNSRTDSAGHDYTYTTIRDFATTTATFGNGDDGTITGSFDQVVNGSFQTFTIDSSDFTDRWDPMPTFSTSFFNMVVVADPTSGRGLLWGPPMLSVAPELVPGSRTFAQIPWGNPLDPDWDRVVEASAFGFRRVRLPGATNTVTLQTFVRAANPLTTTATIEAGVLPPAALQLDGVAAHVGGTVPFDGEAPVRVSWQGDARAERYTVFVERVALVSGTFSQRLRAATITTTETEALIPAEALSVGEFYAVRVQAHADGVDYAGGVLRGSTVLGSTATSATGLYRFDASCGNGDVDEGEDCDEAGAAADCDPDCSAPLCGDGLLNPLADEVCDLGTNSFSSASCDPDCTVPMCGDGVTNGAAGEGCDDGDMLDSGNGCTADCQYSGVCGNGTLEVLEQCDQGGDTVNCDGDCTIPECQDGWHNPAIGEECDDGNFEDGDDCDTDCTFPG